jgi:sigma-B regulation protein RsbQ
MPTDQLSPVQRRNNVTVSGNRAGRPMVFAHGFGCSQDMWNAVAPAFEEDYLVVLYDQVGAGGSDLNAYDANKYDSLHGYAEDLLDILDDLDLSDAVFVGHSVSAMIGVLAAVRKPDRFGALILVGPSPRYINAEGYTGGFGQEDIDSLLDALDANYLGWSAAMAPLIMGNSDKPAFGDSLIESFCNVNPAIAEHFARVTFLSDNRRDLREVTTPTLVLQCQEDIIAPLSVGQFVHEQIPGSSLVVMSATGHCPNLSAPEELRDEIRAYLG